MGKASRDKGKRGEYVVRDALRAAGFQAERVPLSGAFAKYEIGEGKNYAGDVRATRDGREWLFEVKVRKDSFKSIYNLFEAMGPNNIGLQITPEELVTITCDPLLAIGNPHAFIERSVLFRNAHRRVFQKILKMRELLKGADILVIKDDHKPLLWIRYW